MKILLIEDDRGLAELLRVTLTHQRYQVEWASDGQMGWDLVTAIAYDLILLDLQLPKLDGITFCQRLRQFGNGKGSAPNQSTPVLLLTGQHEVTHKVLGLDAGADDYLVKPINAQELLARVRALLRRGTTPRSPLLCWGGLCLNPSNCEVTYLGQPISLTSKEYELLELFLRNPEQLFSQSRLLDLLWTWDEAPSENAVRAHIKALRQKLKQAGAPDVIETVYKLGYRLRAETQKSVPESNAKVVVATPSSAISSEFMAVWQACYQDYITRLDVIEQAAIAWGTDRLLPDLRQAAAQEAHTLAGSLGSYGLDTASEASRQIQQLLKQPLEQTANQGELLQLIAQVRQVMQEVTPAATDPIAAPSLAANFISAQPPALPNALQSGMNVLIVEDDLGWADCLATVAAGWQWETRVAANVSQARRMLTEKVPDLILLDLYFAHESENGLTLLAELKDKDVPIPVIVMTVSDAFVDRVQAARLGSSGFLCKPIAPNQVMAAIAQHLPHGQPTPAKLLLVDDDPGLTALLRQFLEPEGFHLTCLHQAAEFWYTLEHFNPDLLILDVTLAEEAIAALPLDGLDLCRVIRNDAHWHSLPILLLSATTDPERIQQGFEAGADDFLRKPIAKPELLARIHHWLAQGKQRRR